MSRDIRYIKLINTTRWRNCRERQLHRHPLCQRCEEHGRIRLAEEVHHIRPVESAGDYNGMKVLAYDPDNLMSLCRECHHIIHEQMHSHSKASARDNARRETESFMAKFLGKKNGAG
jgi:5-methylcytosine-specific restriction protein A